MKSVLLLPLALTLFLVTFFFRLPDLKTCDLIKEHTGTVRMKKSDYIILLLITCLYAGIAFFRLGNCYGPEKLVFLSEGDSELLVLDVASDISYISLYEGIGTGTYSLSFSSDGVKYSDPTEIKQNGGDILKWHFVSLDEKTSGIKNIRIDINGYPQIGELAFYDSEGMLLKYSSSIPELNDEQDSVPDKSDFMNSCYFDEIYHARTALEHLYMMQPYEISHPPLGKLIISAGIKLFGNNPFGWRFSGTLFGVLMLPAVYIFLLKMFMNSSCAYFGTVLLATDFMHFTQTRIATIDTYAVFFIILMYLFMYLYLTEEKMRYLALSGVFFGFGTACKWTCIYAGAGLAVVWLIYRISVYKSEGISGFIKNALFCIPFFIIIPCIIYYLSYIPYGLTAGLHGPLGVFSKKYLQIVIDNQSFMFRYHAGVTATHPYSSKWYQWILNIRPILYYLEYFDNGRKSTIGAFLNPVLCWGGLYSLFIILYTMIVRRDSKAVFIFTAYAAQIVPWIFVKRITFEYHYFAASVFLVFAMTYVYNIIRLSRKDNYSLVCIPALSTGMFVLFYPVLSGSAVSISFASEFIAWLKTWPF